MAAKGTIYLSGRWLEGVPGMLEVPAETLVALFTLQYCQNQSIGVVLVTNRVEAKICKFPVSVESLCFGVEVRGDAECPRVLRHCELPAMIPQQQEEEEGVRNKDERKNADEQEEKIKKYEENEEWKDEEVDEEGVKKTDGGLENGDSLTIGPWCCAGLCSSLRLAVQKLTDTKTLENNRSNRHNRDRGKQQKGDNRHNAKEDKGKIGNTAIGTEHRASISNTGNGETISDANAANAPHYAASLLGFRGGCLQACAEVSVWTKFCEVEAPLALLTMALAPCGGEEVVYPEELVRYECHLRRPPILHNALKRTQKQIKETVKDGEERDQLLRRPLAQLPPLCHQYAEGPDMTLADLMLFPCFHVLLTNLTSLTVDPVGTTPLVNAWHGTLVLNEHIQMALPVLEGAIGVCRGTVSCGVPPRVVVPSVPDVSIYKSDPERSKAGRGTFTRQGDVQEVLGKVQGATVEPQYTPWPSTSIITSSQTVPLPTLLQALSLEGHIPESRLARKAEQVENMCSAVLALSCPGDVIVDFCSGGGHVGIPLAQCLPQCHILLVENKVPSLERARERVRGLRLSNVSFVQTNLDYFRGDFNIGVSLHACGVATDLVLGKCVAQGAAFVVAPCCYGGIRPNHIVSYPRSQAFRSLITLDQYLILGHAADQTHGTDNPKTEQGQLCMRLVDGDRLAAVREAGYTTSLALMQPATCSPKNHILLGRPTTPRPPQM